MLEFGLEDGIMNRMMNVITPLTPGAKRRIAHIALGAALVLCLAVFWCAAASANSNLIKETGMLTSVEPDGTVIIDSKGYPVDPSVVVVNLRGELSSLDELALPAKVEFKYAYEPKGPVILVIRERPR
jgi:hypothetical protein